MYRRIQLIRNLHRTFGSSNPISGIIGSATAAVIDSWARLYAAHKSVAKNSRFYFTEKGWASFGREVVAACRDTGQQYRVIAVRERDVDVLYEDEMQVMVKFRNRRG